MNDELGINHDLYSDLDILIRNLTLKQSLLSQNTTPINSYTSVHKTRLDNVLL